MISGTVRGGGVVRRAPSRRLDGVPPWLAFLAAYVIGSVDFAVVVARAHGVDIHNVGSGNPGTSNVLRTLGRGPAVMVLVGDALKGVIAAALGWMAGGGALPNEPLAAIAGLCAVAGHCYPVFHRFRGGKGVATGSGVLLFLVPAAALILAAVWAVTVKLTKVASIGSLTVVALALPLAFWQGMRGATLAWVAAILALIVWRHRPNIMRMLRRSEQRVTA